MKKPLNADDVRMIVKNDGIEFIRLQFVDIFGAMKNVAITAEMLDLALANKITFDGSSIEGFVRIEESDMLLYPDASSFAVLPWFKEHRIARMICDVYRPDGTPFIGDPRFILRRAVNEAREMGFEFFVGPECEFFFFQKDETGKPTTVTHDNAGYFDIGPLDNGEKARIDIVATLQKMGFEIEAAHHESAPGQHEIDFKYSDALSAADNIVTFKFVVKTRAKENGLHATFMPKPVNGAAGNGMHCNMSLFKAGLNAFYDRDDPNGLSETAYYFIGGLMAHAKGMAAITNPLVNSYKRLVSGYEAPVYIAWSRSNRSPLIRIPSARGDATRIELRNPDPSCNPYLALAVMLRAGLDGIKNRIRPDEQITENIYKMTKEEIKNGGINKLPSDLGEALIELEGDELVVSTLDRHIFENYVKAKRIEWMRYRNTVHQWEIDEFLGSY